MTTEIKTGWWSDKEVFILQEIKILSVIHITPICPEHSSQRIKKKKKNFQSIIQRTSGQLCLNSEPCCRQNGFGHTCRVGEVKVIINFSQFSEQHFGHCICEINGDILKSFDNTWLIKGVEVSCVDNDISGLIGDVTIDHLELNSAQHGRDPLVSYGDMAVKGR